MNSLYFILFMPCINMIYHIWNRFTIIRCTNIFIDTKKTSSISSLSYSISYSICSPLSTVPQLPHNLFTSSLLVRWMIFIRNSLFSIFSTLSLSGNALCICFVIAFLYDFIGFPELSTNSAISMLCFYGIC